MIQTVSFKNFKALRDLTISLERFTVLVGPNASGKTSVLQGLDSLFFLRHNDPRYFSKEREPYLLDQLAPEEVRLMIADERRVMCAGLGDHPQIDRWKEIMRPGEVWSMVGEEWVKKRSAAPHA